MKRAAQLSSRLLARKGEALPSPGATSFDPLAERIRAGIKREHHLSEVPELHETSEEIYEKPDVTDADSAATASLRLNIRQRMRTSPQRFTPQEVTLDQKPARVEKSAKKSIAPAAKKASAGKRIAMTLRMDDDLHLKLRLFSAHANKSCQDILTKALDSYLADHGQDYAKKNCPCLNADV